MTQKEKYRYSRLYRFNRQAGIEVIKANPDRFEVVALTANNNIDLLIEQAIEFQPDMVAAANENFILS